MDANLLKGHLDLVLLAILDGEPKYGLEISKLAQARTDGYLDFKVGSLYPALHRLEAAGWVAGEFGPSPRGGAPVRYYRLTESGQKELKARQQQFEEFSAHIRGLWGRA